MGLIPFVNGFYPISRIVDGMAPCCCLVREGQLRVLAIMFGALALSACANSVGTSARTEVSSFDNSRSVSISEHATGGCPNMRCIMIGASYDQQQRLSVLSFGIWGGYTNILTASLNIDGNIISLKPLGALTDFRDELGRKSMRTFEAPLDLVRSIVASRRTWVRVGTSDGRLEDFIVDNGKDSKAFHALQRFLAQIGPTPGAPVAASPDDGGSGIGGAPK